ncbi:protein decapping 5-like [Gossypium australe]|uniref:Protein decapping 5-like n=1 Tax=Gossypium australe TaxID=47621 RepID=A0A5B6WNV9_9ROSI|nr:protein decapping 5-like [Gossypium australe]
METDISSTNSGSTADSYIGSVISLTSKSEIRYEGVLYNINPDESCIGLKNVRSFGTEGRKKDGPHVPPSDKVYEYILFRGSDIKDLQVKSSPPAQPTPPINDDPAIIQSQFPHPFSTTTSALSAATRPLTDPTTHAAQMGLPGSNYQAALPLYLPGGNLGSWGASPPPPTANGNGLPMPMYWEGYYGPPNRPPHLHHQSLLRPSPGQSMLPFMQQPMQYPNFNAPFPIGLGNLQSSSLPEAPPPLFPPSTGSPNVTSTLSSDLPPAPSASLASEALLNAAPSPAISPAALGASLPAISPLTTGPELNPIVPPIAHKPSTNPTILHQTTSQAASSIIGVSNSVSMETPTPSMVTPGQLLESGTTVVPSPQPDATVHKDVEVVQVFSSPTEPSAPVVSEAQPPILPLPCAAHKNSRPVTKFTEDFDFMAMNEKFKKDEVWGHLGKSSKSNLKDKEGDASDEDGYQDEDDAEPSMVQAKAVYNKDDFFDTLSCNALDNDTQNGRPRFSEQMKLDTQTFGVFSRHRGGRGGRFRGGYNGRGYGHVGRGSGRAMSMRAP